MLYLFDKLLRSIVCKPGSDFEIFDNDVKYTYHRRILKKYERGRITLSLFVDNKFIDNYWRSYIWQFCPCHRFGLLYRINPHAKSFLRIELNYLHFIMPYLFIYVGKFYFGKYTFIWYHYLIYDQFDKLPYDNYYLKCLLCVLM